MQTSCHPTTSWAQAALEACDLLPAIPMPWERPVAGICVGAAAPLRLPLGGDGGQLRGRLGGAQPPPQLAHAPHPPHPVALLMPHVACSVLSGASVRVAERADGGGPTARVPGIAAAAAAAVAAVVAARPCRESGLVGAARVRV